MITSAALSYWNFNIYAIEQCRFYVKLNEIALANFIEMHRYSNYDNCAVTLRFNKTRVVSEDFCYYVLDVI